MDIPSVPSCSPVHVWSDASGHLIASPSLGILVPAKGKEGPLVASLALPRVFLLAKDQEQRKCYCKTTTLESLVFPAALCLDPLRFVGRDVVFHIDNIAAVTALQKGHSKDIWASTLIRASRVIAASIGCTLFSEWERRRSSRQARTVDDLTHNLVAELTDAELFSYLQQSIVEFPEPLQNWMNSPRKDLTLGFECVHWIWRRFPGIKMLRPSLLKDL